MTPGWVLINRTQRGPASESPDMRHGHHESGVSSTPLRDADPFLRPNAPNPLYVHAHVLSVRRRFSCAWWMPLLGMMDNGVGRIGIKATASLTGAGCLVSLESPSFFGVCLVAPYRCTIIKTR